MGVASAAGKNWVKYAIGFVVCFAIRLVPFRPPNVEPVMTATMPETLKKSLLVVFPVFLFR